MPLLLLLRKKSRSRRLLICKRIRNAFGLLPTFCDSAFGTKFHMFFCQVSLIILIPCRSKLYIACSDFFIQKIRVRSYRCSSFFAKSHVHVGYSFASAFVTPLAYYQLFAIVPSAQSFICFFLSSFFNHTHSMSEQALYRLLRFFIQKIRVRSCRCSSFFAKSHVHVGYSFASAFVTPLAHYQLFASLQNDTVSTLLRLINGFQIIFKHFTQVCYVFSIFKLFTRQTVKNKVINHILLSEICLIDKF